MGGSDAQILTVTAEGGTVRLRLYGAGGALLGEIDRRPRQVVALARRLLDAAAEAENQNGTA
ncbi:hypothetical protein P7L78_19055 [Tistrella bauzanensis]|uniref:hypothetical protein n=1 Tax=Tistrella TaxID=171436 RepID=UPI0031F61226